MRALLSKDDYAIANIRDIDRSTVKKWYSLEEMQKKRGIIKTTGKYLPPVNDSALRVYEEISRRNKRSVF